MTLYRKKPVEVEAVQLRWDTWSEMCEFAGVGSDEGQPHGVYVFPNGTYSTEPPFIGEDIPSVFFDARIGLLIPTLEGTMLAMENDWVIRGVKGELYPCKPDIFEATYEPVS